MTQNKLAMVSKWMVNGNISQFVRGHPAVNRFELVSISIKFLRSYSLMVISPLQLSDVGMGLIYVHGRGIIHGDLKGVRFLLLTCIHPPI